MFGIGPLELLVLAIVALVLIGPERMPELMRMTVRTVTRLQNYWQQLYLELKQGSGIDELNQDIHNAMLTDKQKTTKKPRNNKKN